VKNFIRKGAVIIYNRKISLTINNSEWWRSLSDESDFNPSISNYVSGYEVPCCEMELYPELAVSLCLQETR